MISALSCSSGGTFPVVSIVCPAFNEEAVLPLFHAALIKTLKSPECPVFWEIIYVDDGSLDQTWATMVRLIEQMPRSKAIRLARNAGQQHAMTAGIEHATGEAVITMDTDLQHPPELILDLVQGWIEGAAIIQTVRLEDHNLSLFKRMTSKLFGYFMGWLSGLDVRPGAADFRLLDRTAVNSLNCMQDNPRLMRAAVASLNRPTRYMKYYPRNRAAGISKYGVRKMVILAMQGFWTYGQGIALAFKACCAVGALGIVVSIPATWVYWEASFLLGIVALCVSLGLFLLSLLGLSWFSRHGDASFIKRKPQRYVIDSIVECCLRDGSLTTIKGSQDVPIAA